ncbi:hypothetical protein ASPZODRAFT_1305360 [Penicilliopsis zonata CBS 506.65]|uniref:Zn(2)-C6 fungal-type domain-containing protein n=1 Tax=Penicilliopsis zonata CBS 506.65 TaxID=1073090 RepID=A0A1L9S5Z4_9EURO|nr:hypothetical protein ASPZODRAFT_1305360 [Penicilliopsis zonata CBS 506.65]OJJ42582.1 hypothetical protein ASPZODRAFT_1305360 [Penicilliopsis zonata CBS 506.65]
MKAAKRSACDRCRAKRVRCPRPADSIEPCARCVRLGEACVTGSPGYPGRPRKMPATPTPTTPSATQPNSLGLLDAPAGETMSRADSWLDLLDDGFFNLSEDCTLLNHELPSVYPGHDSNRISADGLESATGSLVQFGERMERRVSAIDAFFSDPRNVVENCPEEGPGMTGENPVATAIQCTEEFIQILQTVMTSTLSTETTLLILTGYLRLMRLYDSLFRNVYRRLSQIPSETIQSVKVKAVLRIGGISSLQDMSGKVYARGVIEVIEAHLQTVERCLGLPVEYCLSGKTAAPSGIFTSDDRARLLHTVMAQEDVGASYVQSIRQHIRMTVALWD